MRCLNGRVLSEDSRQFGRALDLARRLQSPHKDSSSGTRAELTPSEGTLSDLADDRVSHKNGAARGALQAAWLAQFPDATGPRDALSAELLPYYPELREAFGDSCPYGPNPSCPAWPRCEERTLEQPIVHLEDVHHETREEIIRWLDAHGL